MAGVWVAGMGRSTDVFLQLEHFFSISSLIPILEIVIISVWDRSVSL